MRCEDGLVLEEEVEKDGSDHDGHTRLDYACAASDLDAQVVVAGRRRPLPVGARCWCYAGAEVGELITLDVLEVEGDGKTEGGGGSGGEVSGGLSARQRYGGQGNGRAVGSSVRQVGLDQVVGAADDVVAGIAVVYNDVELDGLSASNSDDGIVGVGHSVAGDGHIGLGFADKADAHGAVGGIDTSPGDAGVGHQGHACVLVDGTVAALEVGHVAGGRKVVPGDGVVVGHVFELLSLCQVDAARGIQIQRLAVVGEGDDGHEAGGGVGGLDDGGSAHGRCERDVELHVEDFAIVELRRSVDIDTVDVEVLGVGNGEESHEDDEACQSHFKKIEVELGEYLLKLNKRQNILYDDYER